MNSPHGETTNGRISRSRPTLNGLRTYGILNSQTQTYHSQMVAPNSSTQTLAQATHVVFRRAFWRWSVLLVNARLRLYHADIGAVAGLSAHQRLGARHREVRLEFSVVVGLENRVRSQGARYLRRLALHLRHADVVAVGAAISRSDWRGAPRYFWPNSRPNGCARRSRFWSNCWRRFPAWFTGCGDCWFWCRFCARCKRGCTKASGRFRFWAPSSARRHQPRASRC